jgi:hypothetical protein
MLRKLLSNRPFECTNPITTWALQPGVCSIPKKSISVVLVRPLRGEDQALPDSLKGDFLGKAIWKETLKTDGPTLRPPDHRIEVRR